MHRYTFSPKSVALFQMSDFKMFFHSASLGVQIQIHYYILLSMLSFYDV